MNTFGVVYMSTVGRGTIVGAPEGTQFVEPITAIAPVKAEIGKASLTMQNRSLQVSVPSESKLEIMTVNGKTLLSTTVSGNRSVSLKKIPTGHYIAKIADIHGKTLLKKAISIK